MRLVRPLMVNWQVATPTDNGRLVHPFMPETVKSTTPLVATFPGWPGTVTIAENVTESPLAAGFTDVTSFVVVAVAACAGCAATTSVAATTANAVINPHRPRVDRVVLAMSPHPSR
ncbi:MAG: hypothetical protein ACTHN0_04275 [Aquihabitans sp.]